MIDYVMHARHYGYNPEDLSEEDHNSDGKYSAVTPMKPGKEKREKRVNDQRSDKINSKGD